MPKRDRRETLSRPTRLYAWSVAVCIFCGIPATHVSAEELQEPGTSAASSVVRPGHPQPSSPSSKYEAVMLKGQIISYPPVEHTASGDFPARAWLAKHGIGFYGYSVGQFGANLLSAPRSGPDGRQKYFGQKPTGFLSTTPHLIIDLSRYGIENGQIVVAGILMTTTWEPAGPSQIGFASITYYQTFFNKLIELKLGYVANDYEFYGAYVGGNLASSIFGSSGSVPREMGISFITAPRPATTLTVNAGYFYDRMSVQLSSSPDGYVQEDEENPSHLGLSTKNTGVLFINEVGYRQPATASTSWRWLRGGYMRNTSDYIDYKFGNGVERSRQNYAFYLMGDSQVIKFRGGAASRGINAGFSAHVGLDRYLPIAQTYQGRLFVTGPLKKRPGDMFSIILTDNIFSKYAVALAEKGGAIPVHSSWTITGAASVEVGPGTYGGLALSYTDKPVPIGTSPGSGHLLQLIGNIVSFY